MGTYALGQTNDDEEKDELIDLVIMFLEEEEKKVRKYQASSKLSPKMMLK